MKASKIITIIILLIVFFPIVALSEKIRGTYLLSNTEEYMQIDNGKYKIIRTQVCPPCFDLDEGDSLLSCGSVEYSDSGFVKITSDPDSNVTKTIKVEEIYDPQLTDSVKIQFVFPFKGKFRIKASAGCPFKSTECNILTIPRQKYVLDVLSFEIYNLNLHGNRIEGDYLGRMAYVLHELKVKNKTSNSFLITIPCLTNSYFGRYYISGEYAKVEDDKIIWRNRHYLKISSDLIIPKESNRIRDIDDPSGVDWVDK